MQPLLCFTNFVIITGSIVSPTRVKAKIVPLIYSEVIIGNMAELTCDLTSSVPGDYVLLVLWYKDGETMPFYSAS
ncbi:putative Nephrin [Daphnia magna]|uniref:Putative Nephrin n=1 Tax=Daphnia magna TaxID=35525 RepID=A0A164TQM6_9CRUS|nr:putative Nephrin [Daphnia magna]